jgi:hypothetical protein
MDTRPPGKSTGREIVERAVEAGLGSVPLAGAALAVTFVTALNWRLEQRREEWFTQLAEGVEDLRQRVEGIDLRSLAGNDLFVDAVVTATRTVEHTHQEEKISALRNAVLNSLAPDAPRTPGRPCGRQHRQASLQAANTEVRALVVLGVGQLGQSLARGHHPDVLKRPGRDVRWSFRVVCPVVRMGDQGRCMGSQRMRRPAF